MKNYMDHFLSNRYRFHAKDNILEEKDLGICTDISSILTPWHSVAAMTCFQGCPYTCSAFQFDVRFDGDRISGADWVWLPNGILRRGSNGAVSVESVTAVVPGMRAVVLKLTVSNLLQKEQSLPITVMYRGKCRREETWDFSIPDGELTLRKPFPKNDPNTYFTADNTVGANNEGSMFLLTASMAGMRNFPRAFLWENALLLAPGERATVYFSAHIGAEADVISQAKQVRENYEQMIERSFDWLEKECRRIYDNLPRLTSSDPELDNLYYRSLVTYMLCRWENPDLCALPYFSTGSINGACMCSYLWDYCGGLMLHPIYDSEGNKAQLRAYLRNDLSKSYALNPVTAGPVGPWYQVNQEKIILMVYYHVLFTGEKEFLFEKVGNKTVLEWMRFHAYICDDLSQEVSLFDYGEGGNAHLEIQHWGNGPYNGIMPDLNARRYMNYMRVYALTKAAGCPDETLPRRAAALREKLQSLWNEDARWYDFIDTNGNRDTRYTVQMFKFLNSNVITDREREGLISHLNETEFLSKHGLHSMSKLDPQYCQDDIDNGGGGICTHFTMQVCAQLFETGHDRLATDILKRVYWWGTRMPYMGDSCAANMMLNREDTPLQGDISSVSCAQMIFYYIFGIRADFTGRITVSPVANRPANRMQVENARLCGKVFSVQVEGDRFTVSADGITRTAAIGEALEI